MINNAISSCCPRRRGRGSARGGPPGRGRLWLPDCDRHRGQGLESSPRLPQRPRGRRSWRLLLRCLVGSGGGCGELGGSGERAPLLTRRPHGRPPLCREGCTRPPSAPGRAPARPARGSSARASWMRGATRTPVTRDACAVWARGNKPSKNQIIHL